jgi:hypothetical protein
MRCHTNARRLLFTLVATVGALPAALAQSTPSNPRPSEIHGWVVDTAGRSLAGAQVHVRNRPAPMRTDDRGEFRTGPLAAGEHVLIARLPGFAPETVSVGLEEGETLDVRISLRSIVAKLPEMVVKTAALPARLQAFELRRERQRVGAQFITHEEIEKRAPLVTTDLLRRMQGFKVYDSAGVSVAVSTRGPKPTLRRVGGPCVLRIGVDGTVYSAFAINSIPPADIHGIEIYTGANIPPEFSSGARDSYCGLIMIWLR